MRDEFTLLKIDCTDDDDPALDGQRERYEAAGGLLPAIRLASPQGEVLAKMDDGSVTAEQFLEFLKKAQP